ncbi:MAG: M15 family metallopeptidase [Ignavibacteria bacterium]|nr:M15 family metallopeptidase [Ignavibacteria bacterium]
MLHEPIAAEVVQTQEFRGQNAKPPDVPDRWKGLIGEYALGRDTVSVLERDGLLAVLSTSGNVYLLREDQRDVYRIDDPNSPLGGSIAFRRGERGQAILLESARGQLKSLFIEGPGRAFRIKPSKPVEILRAQALRARPPVETGNYAKSELVELTALDSTVGLDIRYATTNNFMGAVFYSQARAFLQRPAAEALVRAHRALKKLGYGLLVHDAYRPWYVTKMFWDATPNHQKIFVADPSRGSRHNRGCAVDLSLYDLTTGKPVEMVSGYDEFSYRAFSAYQGGTSLQRWHRDLLRRVMEKEGYTIYEWEWWHFDYRDWRRYPIGTATFEEIH